MKDDEDITQPIHCPPLLPTLKRVLAVVEPTPYRVSFYNPVADPDEPWLWLSRGQYLQPGYELLKLYDGMDEVDLAQYLKERS